MDAHFVANQSAPLIKLVAASKFYVSGDSEVHALDAASLQIQRGE